MKKEESDLEKLKKEYSEIQKKYSLPTFKELNDDFNIDKIAEIEAEYPIREIRRIIADKISNYLRFIESLLNPINVPMFVFSVVKSIKIEDKKRLGEIYKKLAKMEIELVKVEVSFYEEKEAEFIKKSYNLWQEIKKEISEIIEVILKNWDNKFDTSNKNYFA
jgi:hypothetical protein